MTGESFANASSSMSGLFFSKKVVPRNKTSQASARMLCFVRNLPAAGISGGSITPLRRKVILERAIPPAANSSTSCSAVAITAAAPASILLPHNR